MSKELTAYIHNKLEEVARAASEAFAEADRLMVDMQSPSIAKVPVPMPIYYKDSEIVLNSQEIGRAEGWNACLDSILGAGPAGE